MKTKGFILVLPLLFSCNNNKKVDSPNDKAVVVEPKQVKSPIDLNKERIQIYQSAINQIAQNFKRGVEELNNNSKLQEVYKAKFENVTQMLSAYNLTDSSITDFEKSTSANIDWANNNASLDSIQSKLKQAMYIYKGKYQDALVNWEKNVLPSVKPSSEEWIRTFIVELSPVLTKIMKENIQITEDTIKKIDSVQ